ncbi:helix-turn-helix transcriptional regulator [uncultured Cohaesibacter sp.]|uniref:helix-turn-helix transcriptional regulator n=1 Tax=uncultured Cohaesibacter sp. TaxID=1002546 RepID=UPI00374898DB
MAEGWTSNEVADQLGMTRDGVNYHLREAKKALGTHNLTHTVATALRRKLI